MSGSREGYQENVVVSVGVMIVFSLFAGKGGLSGHKHIYWNLIWQDLRGFIIFFLLKNKHFNVSLNVDSRLSLKLLIWKLLRNYIRLFSLCYVRAFFGFLECFIMSKQCFI